MYFVALVPSPSVVFVGSPLSSKTMCRLPAFASSQIYPLVVADDREVEEIVVAQPLRDAVAAFVGEFADVLVDEAQVAACRVDRIRGIENVGLPVPVRILAEALAPFVRRELAQPVVPFVYLLAIPGRLGGDHRGDVLGFDRVAERAGFENPGDPRLRHGRQQAGVEPGDRGGSHGHVRGCVHGHGIRRARGEHRADGQCRDHDMEAPPSPGRHLPPGRLRAVCDGSIPNSAR